MSIFSSLKRKLTKTSEALKSCVRFLGGRVVDSSALLEIESALLSADLGIEAVTAIIERLKKARFGKTVSEDEIKSIIREEIAFLLDPLAKKLVLSILPNRILNVLLVCGVNGSGKTTTAGKLAARSCAEGSKVTLVACDTFRAAAVEQLELLAQRVGVHFLAMYQALILRALLFEVL